MDSVGTCRNVSDIKSWRPVILFLETGKPNWRFRFTALMPSSGQDVAMFSRCFVIAFAAISVQPMAAQSDGTGMDRAQIARINLDSLDGKRLMPVVEILGTWPSADVTTGTGFFLKNCLVITNLHVLEPSIIKEWVYKGRPMDERSLVGNEYPFITQQVSPGGARLHGALRVLVHGNYSQQGQYDRAAEDWAIGEDLECLSQKANLGYFVISLNGYDLLKDEDLYSAGFSLTPGVPNPSGLVVVDPKCQVDFEHSTDLWRTNCAVGHRGSGSVAGKRPADTLSSKLFAVGLFVGGHEGGNYVVPLGHLYRLHHDVAAIIDTTRTPR
jgi:hypothetical protein